MTWPGIKKIEETNRRRSARKAGEAGARPMSYYEGLCAMTNDELESEQARLRAGRERELQGLNGRLPPMNISEDHPGWDFDTYDRRSWLVDSVWGPRLRKEMGEMARRLSETQDPELRKRLEADLAALGEKMTAMEARYAEREKTLDARSVKREA
jgi:hypothetical protein